MIVKTKIDANVFDDYLMIKRGGGFEIEVLKSKIAVHGSVSKKALFWLYINFEFAFISLLYIGIGDRLGG